MDKEIIEGNKLIAEFMSAKQDTYGKWFGSIGFMGYEVRDFKYHASWDWLMSVVVKIKLIGENAKDESLKELLLYIRTNNNIFDLLITESKEKVWKYVVEFIKWYNLNIKD